MPRAPKRELVLDSDSSEAHASKKKPNKRSYTKWTADEEAGFLRAVNAIVSANLWAKAKQNDRLALRGSDGVTRHWQAMYKRMVSKQP